MWRNPMIITEHDYNFSLVLLSYVVASIASFTALELARRVTRSRGTAADGWLAAGAGSMGIGIWSMHFIGMLAYDPHMPLSYDVPITLLSLAVAIISSAFALFIGSQGKVTAKRLAASGIVMGAGIASMHYTGMEAAYYVADHSLLHAAPTSGANSLWLATSVGFATLIILGATLLVMFFDR